jgi:integrase
MAPFSQELEPPQNPGRFMELGRDVYIDDTAYRKLWDKADVPLREAMDLAYLTGQRPADILKLDERHLRDGILEIRQNKTRARLRIEILGELASVIRRIATRKSGLKLHSTKLVVDECGEPIGAAGLRFRFDRARLVAGVAKSDFQFRDLRAKAGTDKEASDDIRGAQALLGHGSVSMTEHYVRKRGSIVKPTK